MSADPRQEKIAGGAWILEQFTHDEPSLERNAARRVLSEVQRAWPGDVHRLWWKWLSEAATSLGLPTKIIDCSVEEAIKLARDGGRFTCYSEDPEPSWLGVMSTSGGKYDVALATDSWQNKTVSIRGLRRQLQRLAVDGTVRCVLVQPEQMVAASSVSAGKVTNPLDRLRQLIQPEWSDIWVVIVFAFVVSLLMLATPLAVEGLVNTVAFGRFLQPIVVLALILLTFLGFQGAIRALQTYVVEIIQRRLFARVAADLAFRLPRAEIESTDEVYLPELVNRFFDVVTVQKVAAQLLLDGLGLGLTTVIGMAVLGFYHPWLLGFDVLLLVSIAFIILGLGRGGIASAVKESKHKYYMAGWLEDIARCPITFRNDGGADFALERADRLIHQYLSARKSHFRIVFRQILFAVGFQAVASTVLLGLGGWLVISGELTLGQLVAAELIVTTIVGAFAKIGKHIESYYDLLASVDKLGALFDLPTERQDGSLGIANTGPIHLELSSVGYVFPGRERTLNGVTAKVPEARSLAVLGQSGAGKSTLLDLVHGTRNPTDGHLTVDGFDPLDLRPDVLRGRVALARSGEAFHATIAENVHLHRDSVSAVDVRDVLRDVGLLDSVMRLDEGFDTDLTSSGAPLSENQARLLVLARAAVGRPGLLLIDGILDSLADEDLANAMEFLLRPGQPWTLVIATGREAIAEQCDNRIDLRSPWASASS